MTRFDFRQNVRYLMGHEHEAFARPDKFAKDDVEFVNRARIEAGGRLVENQNLGIVNQGPANHGPALFAG